DSGPRILRYGNHATLSACILLSAYRVLYAAPPLVCGILLAAPGVPAVLGFLSDDSRHRLGDGFDRILMHARRPGCGAGPVGRGSNPFGHRRSAMVDSMDGDRRRHRKDENEARRELRAECTRPSNPV